MLDTEQGATRGFSSKLCTSSLQVEFIDEERKFVLICIFISCQVLGLSRAFKVFHQLKHDSAKH
uniref:Uncharacterized protein n=1 Tax=Arundo donax TaxID=35708 RepID=A0A0A9C4P7_ARUDO